MLASYYQIKMIKNVLLGISFIISTKQDRPFTFFLMPHTKLRDKNYCHQMTDKGTKPLVG